VGYPRTSAPEPKVCDIKEGGDRLKRDNEILKIGVVGQVKAGKSSFLNSLLFEGENVLPSIGHKTKRIK
jgi:tRNA U34 5-carboxymethylaminomethyl modifying GTPase MnmE/TrmE